MMAAQGESDRRATVGGAEEGTPPLDPRAALAAAERVPCAALSIESQGQLEPAPESESVPVPAKEAACVGSLVGAAATRTRRADEEVPEGIAGEKVVSADPEPQEQPELRKDTPGARTAALETRTAHYEETIGQLTAVVRVLMEADQQPRVPMRMCQHMVTPDFRLRPPQETLGLGDIEEIELLLAICGHLAPKDLGSLACVSREFGMPVAWTSSTNEGEPELRSTVEESARRWVLTQQGAPLWGGVCRGARQGGLEMQGVPSEAEHTPTAAVALPALPPGWTQQVSRTTGRPYYRFTATGRAQWERPVRPVHTHTAAVALPPGWTQQVSRTRGRPYYRCAATGRAQWERPVRPAPAHVGTQIETVGEAHHRLSKAAFHAQSCPPTPIASSRRPQHEDKTWLRRMQGMLQGCAVDHAMALVVGTAVTRTVCGLDYPRGTVGEIIEFTRTEGQWTRRVRSRAGTRNFKPKELVLATAEQAAQWELTKAELDAKAAAHLVSLVVGAAVTWTDANDKVPEGTAGEIIEILEDSDERRVRFPGATYRLRPEHLVLATAEQAAQWEALKPELDAKTAHLVSLVVGAVVTWAGADENVPEAGEIIAIRDDSRSRKVRFPGGTRSFKPEQLVLATAEQAGQWESTKAELDAEARRTQQRVEAEHDAQFAMARYYADGAEEPQLCGIYEEGVRAYMTRVGLEAWYDCFAQHLPEHLESVERLRATTGNDLKRMATEAHMRLDEKTKKQVLSAVRKPTVAERKEEEEKRQERAAALIVGAVVTRTGADEDVPTGTAGEIIEVEDGIRRVRFPGGTWKYKPEHLVLATAEQAAQWKALKPELDAKAAAHLATLVVGERVTWTDADDKVREGTAGEIIEILEECNARVTMARYYANGVEEPQLCDYYTAKSVRAYMTSVGLEAWYVYFAQHLPKHLESVERLRATTSADLKRMATKANMRLDEKTKKQVLSALRKCHIDRRVVRFPGATYRLRPEQLVLATTEQAAQWELTKAELDAKAAHLATLVVGERR
jgi:hypothetical protein